MATLQPSKSFVDEREGMKVAIYIFISDKSFSEISDRDLSLPHTQCSMIFRTLSLVDKTNNMIALETIAPYRPCADPALFCLKRLRDLPSPDRPRL